MSEWVECKLEDLITLQRGHDLPKSKMNTEGKIPVAGSNGIIGYHDEATTKALGVTIGRSGNLGNAFIYNEDFWAHNTTLYVKDFKGNDETFIYYLLKSMDFQQFNVGSAVPTLNRNHIHPLGVKRPPLTEQKAIASVLSSLDDKIDLLHRQNKTLEAMAETLFRQWFVEEADESWESAKLGDYVKTNTSLLKKDSMLSEIQYLDTSSLTEGKTSEIQLLSIEEAPSRAKRTVKHNDILISTVRPNQKHYGIVRNPDENLIVSTGFVVVTCNTLSPFFIYLFLTSSEMTEYLHSIAEGSTSTYPSLKPSDIERLGFLLPPKELLDEFDRICNTIWTKIETNYNHIKNMELLRDTMLPKLMSGEIGINV
ncbi:restriction endonuclease subunit S [Marispirochaeta aestuarii]|uniref:restriction endonuclease subunit S n=1 Tax=Marispirochaeta aestuarii TaxID=1963862 RepID=UPI002ABD879A|nr:restriction endonuclease subunit S [Marispirochaeta aestuarii]